MFITMKFQGKTEHQLLVSNMSYPNPQFLDLSLYFLDRCGSREKNNNVCMEVLMWQMRRRVQIYLYNLHNRCVIGFSESYNA